MTEESRPITQKSAAGPEERRRRSQQRRRQRSVFQYITILFAAALVLLLYTFMIERRQHELKQQENQASISDLEQKSVSAVQTLQGMTEENKRLKDEVDRLNGEVKALKDQLAGAEQGQSLLQTQVQSSEKAVEAMEWFWQLNDIYVRGRLKQCRKLIASMEEAGLPPLLPKENTASEDFLSPAERYQNIYDRVMK